ncbi:MAG: GNAT family N-acetyltransferase [Bacteroidales bacterium]|nr:GNAT family N-acetyltransferase [Bacteroidales bacterium]
MLEIIPVNNEVRWNEIIFSMSEYDFYHLAAYHKLDISGEAFLFYYRSGKNSFAFPFIKRRIRGTDYYDVTSVYGYAGPLIQNKSVFSEDLFLFHSELKRYFEDNKIVTAFSTLHPLFPDQSLLLNGFGEVADSNRTIAINLKLSEKNQRKQYARSTKYQINRLKRGGLTVKVAEERKEVDAFINIYIDNMKRVKAASKYFFSADYFYSFLEKIDSEIVLAYYQGEVVSGSLCTFCGSIMQAHLNATKSDFLQLSPLKLVLDKARQEGVGKKMQWLHLGGGRDGQNDSLFEFKSRFSQEQFTFRIWKYVHNKEIYTRILEQKYNGVLPESSFFPLYRL